MAVFTPVSDQDARALLETYDIGELISLRGITAGIENTNFFLHTTQGEYVLTLFEVLTQQQLPFYIELMHYLAERGIPVPQPQTLKNGSRLTALHGKPAAIVSRLPGGYEPAPGALHCALTGATLARAHKAGADFPLRQPNLRGLTWWQETAPKVMPFLTPEQTCLLNEELQAQRTAAAEPERSELPGGPAHCDLFRDNVLFAGTFDSPLMGGFIDFYFAGCDTWLFDVAVAVNDWCIDRDSGEFIPELVHAWLAAYAQERPFTDAERRAWPLMLRAAALRFWLSRLYDYFLPRPAQTLKPHDPRHFERVLQARHRGVLPPLP
ncbi:homoserine kinase [Bordetella holmesii]|uniref:Homoserine kinase n=2 Tax=Bordetella holmesii TaxID=35814 RepID=A0A158M7J7_9BORD|nr:homoserine kinase [Bordetella holmesii]AHV93066.1 homoserine kinase [Bordetella holmesii ATCC 51541]EWM40598.1 homoserine kinase [Bordetella holmesii 35009]EWM43082.1 homoserine kinase [Bordetella holmesii 41130]AMD46585.1 homoserine kinase [Bordetella holmesii H558]AMD48019.1 homoserine kinase [Bordetella holmesii F627]